MNLVFLGPPGAGKGTYAKVLCKRYKIPHISTGDILRAEMKSASPLGGKAKGFVESGKLVPDELILQMMEERIAQPDCAEGFVLDGFPRTVAQAEGLEEISSRAGRELDLVIFFKVSEKTVLFRLGGRRVCGKCGAIYHVHNIPPKKEGICDRCGSDDLIVRKDDEPETIKHRLTVYEKETAPLIQYYQKRGLLKEISADCEVDGLDKKVEALLGTMQIR